MSKRTLDLKKRVVSKSEKREISDKKIYIDLERGRYYTESYKSNADEPEVIRRAKAFSYLLENMTIYIKDGELIVGNDSRDEWSLPFVELSDKTLMDCKEDGYVRKEDFEEFDQLLEYWKDKLLWNRVKKHLTEEEIRDSNSLFTFFPGPRDGLSTNAPDYEFGFKHGLNGIIKQIDSMEMESRKGWNVGPEVEEKVKKLTQWLAMKIAAQAAINWSRRYAKLAKTLAEEETDLKRKEELLKISENCKKCLAEPVETFHEAVQAMWFIQLLTHKLEKHSLGTSVRIDQIFYPYYVKDINTKKISPEDAQELIECLWLKLLETGGPESRLGREVIQGAGMLQIYTLGGQKSDGSDGCNELTKICMRASRELRSVQPSYCLRINSRTPDEYILEALENIKMGLGMPSFENDTLGINQLMNQFGCTLEEARTWALALCKAPHPTGSSGVTKRRPYTSYVGAMFSLALNDGIDMLTGTKFGISTGDASEFKSIEDVLDAFRQQARHAFEVGWRVQNIGHYIESQYFQQPFLSCCYEPFVIKGLDVTEHDERPCPWTNTEAGVVDVVDSLAAMNKLIFEEKKYTMKQLIDAIRKNWEGYKEMRQDFVNAPKWGNDDDYVDKYMIKVQQIILDELQRNRDLWGATPYPLAQSVASWRANGKRVGATPNGRFAGEAWADGGCSPRYGCDKKGLTAVLMSCSKMDNAQWRACLLNQRISPVVLEGEKGKRNFLAYIRAWHDLGLQHVQLNVVDSEVLKAAQKEPEKYTDLIVRVAGYSAYFVQLDNVTQDYIISRTVQSF